jgi:hypothetical protein
VSDSAGLSDPSDLSDLPGYPGPAEPDPPFHLSDWFWDLIAQAQGDADRMRAILDGLDSPDLRRFHEELEDATCELAYDPMFDPFLTDESEDGKIDVAHWAVSQGREYYQDLFVHPERIPRSVEQYPIGVLHDGMVLAMYYDRTGEYPPYRED